MKNRELPFTLIMASGCFLLSALITENVLTQISGQVKTDSVTLSGEIPAEVDAGVITEELLKKGLRPAEARYWKNI